jgi:methylmalonyl-CoA mutase
MADPSELSALFEEFPPVSTDAWEEQMRADLGTPDLEGALTWNSIEGVSLPAYARREDLADLPHVSDEAPASPLAGSNDATTGWRIRQDLWHPDPEQAQTHAATAVDGGASDLGLVSGLPPAPGLSLKTPEHVETVLRDLALQETALHLDRGPAALVLYAQLRAALEEPPFRLAAGGSVGYDPVAALATGRMPSASTAFDWQTALLTENLPSSTKTFTVDLRPYHDAGASAVQELACALGTLSDVLSRLLDRGLSLSSLLPRLQVVVSTSTSYFPEIAKLRALRLLVPQVIDAFAEAADTAVDYAPTDLPVQAQTSRRTETVFDPHVNMLRATTEAMAAVIGGCDVLSVRPYDAPLHPPQSFGARIARNVQLLLRHEAHFDVVADPAAGAYYVEIATHRLAERAWEHFQSLEARGGLLEALRSGDLQHDVAEVRARRQKEVDQRDRVLVGTNHYPDPDERRLDDVEFFSCNNGDQSSVDVPSVSLDALQSLLEAPTDGRLVLRGFRADSPPVDPLPSIRVAEGVETVRLRTERHAERVGRTPVVFLAPLGPPAARSARATFSRHVFGVAGFDVREHVGFSSPREAVTAAGEASPDVFVVCSANDEYPDLLPALREELRRQSLSPLLVVAAAPDQLPATTSADAFVHRHAPLRETLETIQTHLGIDDA